MTTKKMQKWHINNNLRDKIVILKTLSKPVFHFTFYILTKLYYHIEVLYNM